MWGMEIRCRMGIWDATMEFPFQGQGSILPVGFGGLKWNFHSGEKIHSTHRVPFCKVEFPFWGAIFHQMSKNRGSRMETVLQMQPMQVCFVGGGSRRSHAVHLAHKAPNCRSLQPVAWGLREPARIRMKAQRIGVGNRANPNLAKPAGRACALGPNCPVASRAALALHAGLPQAERWNCFTPTLSIHELTDEEFRREFCYLAMEGWFLLPLHIFSIVASPARTDPFCRAPAGSSICFCVLFDRGWR
jgi:hypothetical protein